MPPRKKSKLGRHTRQSNRYRATSSAAATGNPTVISTTSPLHHAPEITSSATAAGNALIYFLALSSIESMSDSYATYFAFTIYTLTISNTTCQFSGNTDQDISQDNSHPQSLEATQATGTHLKHQTGIIQYHPNIHHNSQTTLTPTAKHHLHTNNIHHN